MISTKPKALSIKVHYQNDYNCKLLVDQLTNIIVTPGGCPLTSTTVTPTGSQLTSTTLYFTCVW